MPEKTFTFVPDEVILELEKRINKFSSDQSGTSYCIVVQNDSGEYEYHDRTHQPCIGGEFRKYKKTHGEDCTRPDDFRPNDLHFPFPKGKPCAVGYWWPYMGENHKQEISLLFSERSPWIKGFGSSESIHFIPSDENDNTYRRSMISPSPKDNAYCKGFILKHGKIDPTVWISFLKRLQCISSMTNLFTKAIEADFSETEALVLSTFVTSITYDTWTNKHYVGGNDYAFAPNSSLKKFINQESEDLTGGTWEDRFDYNRPELALIFKDKEKKNDSLVKLLSKSVESLKPEDEIMSVIHGIIKQEMELANVSE